MWNDLTSHERAVLVRALNILIARLSPALENASEPAPEWPLPDDSTYPQVEET